MTKRTAMLMAAGVVAALFAGSIALAFGLSGNTTATADQTGDLDPIVRTVHRTVRVEKDARSANEPVRVVTLSSGSDTTPVDAVPTGDDALEDASDDGYEDEADDRYEDEDHEDDDDDDVVEDHEDDGVDDD